MSKEIETLDKLDRKLLRELDKDSRQSFADLGRTLRIPAETARYRFHSLLQRKLISRTIALIDSGKLGNSYYKVLLKLYNVNETQVLKIIETLVAHDAVNWVARTDGLFDIAFTIRVRQILELSEFIDRLKEDYRRFILRMGMAVNIKVEFSVRDYLVSNKRTSSVVTYTAPAEPHTVDETDLAILRQLSSDTRRSGASIGAELKLSVETILHRIQKLERGGIITRYTILPNLSRIGIVNYYVFLYFSQASQERILEFVDYCRQQIHINYFIKALGEWDYELNIEVESLPQYREVMMDLTREFSDIIRDYLSLPVTGLYKFTIAP